MGKRGKLEIIKDILNIIKDNKNYIRLTPLLRKSKISTHSFKGYYDEIIKRKLIEDVFSEKDDKHVRLTEKGYLFLERYKSIIEFIDEFDL